MHVDAFGGNRMPGKNKTTLVIVLWVVFFITFILGISGKYWLNDIESMFDEKTMFQKIKFSTIKGASFFFKSYSSFLDFLNQMELKEVKKVDLKQLRLSLDNAIKNMEEAKNQYIYLELIPYNTNALKMLSKFEYKSLQEKHKLNESIFAIVTDYLSNGKIREFYNHVLKQTEEILEKANSIKNQLNSNKAIDKFDKQFLMNLNQQYAQTLLLGQYAANVFQEIKEGPKE